MAGDSDPATGEARPGAGALTPLDPRFRRMLRQTGTVQALLLVAAASIAELAVPGRTGLFWLPAAVLVLLLVAWLPGRHYRAAGYREEADALRVVRGLWTRWDGTVPFTRVQHIDVSQSALERGNGLATLSLHTAGTNNATVSLRGLAHEEALAMRDRVRERLRVFAQPRPAHTLAEHEAPARQPMARAPDTGAAGMAQ